MWSAGWHGWAHGGQRPPRSHQHGDFEKLTGQDDDDGVASTSDTMRLDNTVGKKHGHSSSNGLAGLVAIGEGLSEILRIFS